MSAPDRLDLSHPLHVDPQGCRWWRLQSGWLEPVRHHLALPKTLSPLWNFLASQQDHRHIHLTDGAWELTDKGMTRLAGFDGRAPR